MIKESTRNTQVPIALQNNRTAPISGQSFINAAANLSRNGSIAATVASKLKECRRARGAEDRYFGQ